MDGIIFDIKEMAVHDGPGLRTTVFLKGCPLRCMWCHNPEGLSFVPQLMQKSNCCTDCGKCKEKCSHPECEPFSRCLHVCPNNCLSIAGRYITPKELANELLESAEILGESFGGFTFSGGEPLAQSEFLLEVMDELSGYHLCIETSGYCESETFKKVLDKLQFVIMDIKLADSSLHKQYIGVGNELILKNFQILRQSGKPFIIRTPLIKGFTDTKENLDAIKAIIGDSPWEQLPENNVAGAKYKMLGLDFPLEKEKAKRN
ncbi:MAG: glycyl-radical enzyme activating protein [Clostridia bacterium]|nr:glycyl-radical enzyme activating protein [Clostridia bacterium]